MSVKTVRVQINGVWTTLTKNTTSGKYEGTIAAPSVTSFNVNASHYYPVTVEATDLAGNVISANDSNTTLGNSLKLIVNEVTKPTIAFTAPASGAYLGSNTPTITFQLRDEVSGSGIKISTLSIQMDGGAAITNTSTGVSVVSASNGYDITYTPQSALSDGLHTVVINVQDNDGNAATAVSRSFSVDTTPPVLTVTTPSEATTYRNNASLSVTGTTNDVTSSPVTVTMKLNSETAAAVTVDSSGNFTKALTLTEGTNTIVITAMDSAGKQSVITRNVVLDTVPPVIGSIIIAPNPVNIGQSYVVTVEVTD